MAETIMATFGVAFGLSLTYSFVPGPVTVEALRRGARRGVRAVVSMRLGALAGSLAWAVAGLTGAGIAAQNPQSRLLLSVVGTATLLLVIWRALRPAEARARLERGSGHGDVLAGALIATANPLGGAFWLGVGGSLLAGTTRAERVAEAGAFILGFIAAHLVFTAACAAVIAYGRSTVRGRISPALNLLSVAPLVWFAVSPLLRAR